jgi:hypothetical protein
VLKVSYRIIAAVVFVRKKIIKTAARISGTLSRRRWWLILFFFVVHFLAGQA